MKKQLLGLCSMLIAAGLLITVCIWRDQPLPPEPDPIEYLSSLEPAPAAPGDFEIAAVLEYLCSTAFGGRQTGTEGCAAAGDYVAGFLEEWGYQPLFGDSLAVPYTAVAGDPALAEAEVILHLPNGDITLTEGVDYTFSFHLEDLDVTLPLSETDEDCAGGKAVHLVAVGSSRGKSPIVLRERDVLDASSDVREERIIELSPSAFALAKQAEQVTLRIKASAREMGRNNYCAVLPGDDRSQAMVLCAHVDGTGTWGEVLYPSAHDNASGTVTLLACARQMAGSSLPYDLVFCIFTGEEQSLLGSKALAPVLEEHYDLINVINLDCLGCGVADSLKLLGQGTALGEALWPYLQQAGYIAYEYGDGASDQDSFTHPAVGLCELPEGYRFHQADDTVDTVDPFWVQKIADAVCTYVRGADLVTIAMEEEAQQELEITMLSEEDPLELEAFGREALRQNLTKGFAYDQAICQTVTVDGENVNALFTGWRMLASLEEVAQYYSDLKLPETVDGKAFFGAYVIPKQGAVFTEGDWLPGEEYTVDWENQPVDSVWAYYVDNNGGYLLHVGGTTYDRPGHPGGYQPESRRGYAYRGKNGKFANICYLYRLREAEQQVDGIYWEPVFGYCDTEEDMIRVRMEVKDALEHLTQWYAEYRE